MSEEPERTRADIAALNARIDDMDKRLGGLVAEMLRRFERTTDRAETSRIDRRVGDLFSNVDAIAGQHSDFSRAMHSLGFMIGEQRRRLDAMEHRISRLESQGTP